MANTHPVRFDGLPAWGPLDGNYVLAGPAQGAYVRIGRRAIQGKRPGKRRREKPAPWSGPPLSGPSTMMRRKRGSRLVAYGDDQGLGLAAFGVGSVARRVVIGESVCLFPETDVVEELGVVIGRSL